MRSLIFVLLILITPFQEKNVHLNKIKTYISEDLHQRIKADDIYVILSVDMCHSCLLKHINTLNTNTKPLNLIAVGNSRKKISFNLKNLNRTHINLIYDSKNVAVKKGICSVEEFVIFSEAHKKVTKIFYDNFYSLLNEIK